MDALNLGDSAAARQVPEFVGFRSFPANENRPGEGRVEVGGSMLFWATKRAFDIVMALLALPVVIAVGIALLMVNPFFNPGPLFYRQQRTGRYGEPFTILKFRTMVGIKKEGVAFASAEAFRIRKLGAALRRFRIDELPQIVNVLRDEMSFIGPRPEQCDFVNAFAKTIPGYHQRHAVRPGISGYAQVVNGYADCEFSTKQKLDRDLEYITGAGWKMEGYVFFRTIFVVFTGFGAL